MEQCFHDDSISLQLLEPTPVLKAVIFSIYSITVTLAFSILMSIVPFTSVSGQQINRQSIYVEAYGLTDGLRQSMVSCIQQDSTGLIWLASGDGLHCFNGKRFKAYRIPYKGTYHHSDNMLRMITPARTGEFIISSSSSLFRFNPVTADFKFINRELTVYVVLLDIQLNNSSLAWTLNKGLCLVKNDSLISLEISYPDGKLPPTGFIPLKAAWLSKDSLLIMGEEGIIHIRVNNNLTKSNTRTHPEYTGSWENAPGCQVMTSDTEGNIFIIRGTTIFHYQSKTNWVPVSDPGIPVGLVFCTDHNQNFWFTDKSNQRLFRLNNEGIVSIDLLENSGKTTDTVKTDIKYIYEDRCNNLWIGTDGYGLLKYNPEKVMFNKALIGFTRCLTSIGHNIYAGTYNNGLWKLSETLSMAERLNKEVFDNNEYILDLTTDSHNRIWAVSRDGLYVLKEDGKIIYNYPGQCITAHFIYSDNDTIQLYKDTELLTFSAGNKPGFSYKTRHNEIRSFIKAFNFRWVATPSGLYIFTSNPLQQSLTGKQISNSEIFNVTKVRNEVWASTGNGVEVFTASGQRINSCKAVSELMNEAIYSLLPDKEGRVWFIGIRGLGYIDTKKNQVIRFWPENNLQSLEFNQNASCISENGWFCFGGINGMNSINPSMLKKSGSIPEIRIFSLMVSDTNYSAGIIPNQTLIEIDRRAPNIEGSVFATDYGEVGHGGFSFFLEGYQVKWTEPAPDAVFSYRNLQPGNYRLYVRYTDILKNEGPPQLLLTIHIARAFWQTSWFLILVIILIILSTVLIVRKVQSIRYGNRIKELEREKAIERERTRISKDMHDEVGASLTRISILTELAKKQYARKQDSGEIINKISAISGSVVDELSEIIWAMNPKNDNLETFAAYIRRYTGTFFESTGVNIKFDFPQVIQSIPMTAELRRNLFLIIKEALNNIVKHARAGNVLLKLIVDGYDLIITVKDDGKGMHTPDSVKSSMFFDPEPMTNTQVHKGNGLHNMHSRAVDSGAGLKIESREGEGTKITLSVSLKQASKSH